MGMKSGNYVYFSYSLITNNSIQLRSFLRYQYIFCVFFYFDYFL